MARPPEKPLGNFDEVLERLFQATQSRNASLFSKAIGVNPSAVSRTLKARRIPQGWFDTVCDEFDTTERYLRYGENVVESQQPIKEQETELDAKNETIEAQKVAIGSLQDQVVSLKVENALLKGRLKEGTNP